MNSPFLLVENFVPVIRALWPLLSEPVARSVANHVLHMRAVEDQGEAHVWTALLSTIPSEFWLERDVLALGARTADNWELEDGIDALYARRDPARRAALVEDLYSGSIAALESLNDISAVPEGAVSALIASLNELVRDRLTELRSGVYTERVGLDPARCLVLLNTEHTMRSDWSAVHELLREPRVPEKVLAPTLKAIAARADSVPPEQSLELVASLRALMQQGPRPALPFLGGSAQGGVAEALEALSPKTLAPEEFLAARGTGSADRRRFVHALAQRREPGDLSALVAMATHEDAQVRAAAAGALSWWAARGIAATEAVSVLKHLLNDSGTLIARHVVGAWPAAPCAPVLSLAEALLEHRSGEVRRTALEMVANCRAQTG